MGWLRDLFKNIGDWIHDKIVEPIVDWVKQLIEDTTAWIKIWKHEMRGLLAEWLENDWVFIAAIAAAVAFAFFFPAIKTWVGKLGVVILLKAAWEDVKEGFAEILDFIHIIELDTINTILKILWPDYREAMGELATVTSALAEELGEGSGYIHAAFSVVHGLALVENAFMGTDPKLAELSAFEDTAEGLSRISEKFREYAYNPGLIMSDVINDFYLPRAENIRIAQQATLDSVRENRDKVTAVNTALHDFEGRLTHFIEITPIELQEVITERLQPIADALGDALFVMDTEIMPEINGIIDALALREERQQTINDNILSRIDDPYQLLLQAEYMREEDREALEDYIAELESRAEARDQLAASQTLGTLAAAMVEATEHYFFEPEPVVQPPRTALSFEMPGMPAAGMIPGWYQGEY